MTTTTDPFPDRRDPILPAHHVWIGREPVFRKQQLTFRFALRTRRISSKAASTSGIEHSVKGHNGGIKALIFERQFLAGCFQQTHRKFYICSALAGLSQKLARGINSIHGFYIRAK